MNCASAIWSRAVVATSLVAALSWSSGALADVLAGWDMSGQSNFGTSPLAASTAAANVTVGGLTRGSGVGTSGSGAGGGWGGTNWNTSSTAAAAEAGGQYATFTIAAASGSQLSISSIGTLTYRRSGTGPDNGLLQYQVGSGAFVDGPAISWSSTSTSGVAAGPIDLSGITALQHVPGGTVITFRIVNYRVASGGTSSGTWYIYGPTGNTGNDLEIDGTVTGGTGSIAGSCGTSNGKYLSAAPTANLCATGTASAVGGNGPWTWSCAGAGSGTTAQCSANVQASSSQPLTIFHTNDVHARITPHPWVINQHGADTGFEPVGGAAYLAGEYLALVHGDPTALVLDGGDISEGNPVGDMNCTMQTLAQAGSIAAQVQSVNCATNTDGTFQYGNGGLTAAYTLLHEKLTAIGGARGTRGIDALVVGNHDVRDITYIQNMEQMAAAGVPVISANVRNVVNGVVGAPHFPATTTVQVNGHKIGIIGYTTSTATVGASLASTLTVVDCQWTGSSVCNIADYVNDLRNNQGCDLVILLTHDGHSDLVDASTPVIADTPDAKVPEIAVTGHWHTWAATVWQPAALNYKTIFTESSSYMNYLGELHVDGNGKYVSSVQHVLRNADITPDADIASLVTTMTGQYNAASIHAGHPVDEVVGYTNDDLVLDNRQKWWSADEYPWDGDNSAGQWITDAMTWKCQQLWASSGGCDMSLEAGGGVRADIPAGPVTYMRVYETYPWADDLYMRISMTGQDIINFITATDLDTGFSNGLEVTANDGIITGVTFNGQPIDKAHVYKVAISDYMLANPPGSYTWPALATSTAECESGYTLNSRGTCTGGTLVRDSLSEFMRAAHATQATAYSTGGSRYHFNGKYSGGYRAVVTMMNDADTALTYDDAFIRILQANPETLARRGSDQVPTSLVNSDGSVIADNRLSEQELYRSYMGFKTGALVPGDILEVWGKASFYGGNPEFVDQEGIYGDGMEFKVVGHDASLAKPTFVSSIAAFMNSDTYKNHYIKFLAENTNTAATVKDQNGALLKLSDKTAYANASVPTCSGAMVVTGVPTMESFALRFRADSMTCTSDTWPTASSLSSHVNALPASTNDAAVTLTATAAAQASGYGLLPVADAGVETSNKNYNGGTSFNLFVASNSQTTGTNNFGDERTWLKFDLSSIPAGSIITSASLQLWNWKSAGASLPVEAHLEGDNWTETGITWNTQPDVTGTGTVIDTQTLVSGVTNAWYSWNVTSAAQGELNGDKTLSVMLKAATEGSTANPAPSYGFDSKEYASTVPVLQVTVQAGTGATIASVKYFVRYSADNSSWSGWTQAGTVTVVPYTLAYSFPNGAGYYEFYSVATDSNNNTETAPAYAQAAVHYGIAAGGQTGGGDSQSIAFGALSPVSVGSSVALAATATSGLQVSYSSLTPAVCSVSGSQATAVAAGDCTIAANQAGEEGYFSAASQVTQVLHVTALTQTIDFATVASLTVGGSAPLTATATSNLTVVFSSLTPAICSVSGTTVTANSAGTCTLAADQAGDSTHWLAAPQATQDVVVSGGTGGQTQSIDFPAILNQTLGSGPVAVTVSASSGLTVVLTSQAPAVCSVSGNNVTLLAVGLCTLTASQPGNGTYAAATPVTRSFNVNSAGQGGDSTSDGPVPLWAMVVLALALVGFATRRQQQV